MQYGYFDDEKREYVITRPDTPAPWANYLGSPEYGAIIFKQRRRIQLCKIRCKRKNSSLHF